MRAGGALTAALLLVSASLVIQVSSEDIYWEGEEDASNEFLEVKEHDNSLISHLTRIKRDWGFNFFPWSSSSTTAAPENIEVDTEDPVEAIDDTRDDADADADADGSGAPGLVDAEPREKTLRVTFVAMQPYQDEYSNRDSSQFQNFSKSLANAVNKIYEEQARNRKISGTQRASLVRIQSRTSDDFSCKVTLDIVTTGYYDMDKITDILRNHIQMRRSLEGVVVSEDDFSANVIDPGANEANDCPADTMRCDAVACLPNSVRCNGVQDCADGTDEDGCPPDDKYNNVIPDNRVELPLPTESPDAGREEPESRLPNPEDAETRVENPEETENRVCHDDELQCDHTRCVSLTRRCDGYKDCDDNSDEQNCKPIEEICGADDFRCNSGKCIPKDKQCDRIVDCPDSEDEVGCDCKPGEFKCRDNNDCIEERKRCDGVEHCNDGSDELSCPEACTSDQWQCDYGNCIKRSQRCDGRVDCPTDRSDERNCLALLPQTSAYFMCKDGTYILQSQRCNRQYDCPRGDYSDEVNCPCGDGDFKCDNGYCIPASKHCDRTHDCQDRSDERGCNYGTICMAYQYKCSSGQCVRADAQCNGTVECEDGSDETNCPCKRDEFQCRDGSCLNIALRCDNQRNCPGGEDEHNCGPQQCSPEEFSCAAGSSVPCAVHCDGNSECDNGEDELDCSDECEHPCDGRCLDPSLICNGVEDCSDGTDEVNCDNCDGPDDFRCSNGECLRKSLRCNGLPDCTDLSDEEGCNRTMISSQECTENQFQCSNGICIDSQFWCDDNRDCTDGSDEENCRCKEYQKQCRSGQCILENQFCDGIPDCPDNSDEENCATPGPGFDDYPTTTTWRPVYTTTTRAVLPDYPPRPPYPRPEYTPRPSYPRTEYPPYPQRPDSESSNRGACNRNEWRCENGPCIDANRRCDGHRDCPYDDSDELDCPPNSACNSNEWRCENGPCIDANRRCDGHRDCPYDDSDELDCPPNSACNSNEWRCENGPCIDANRRCDGHRDCPYDDSDELDCPPNSPAALDLKTYPSAQAVRHGGDVVFQCRDEGPLREPVRWMREDGRPLKSDSTDIKGRLEMSKVTTSDSGIYICQAFNYVGTPGSEIKVSLIVENPSTTLRPSFISCQPHEATCVNGQCIPKSAVCDGRYDCADQSDEETCHQNGQCEPNQFHCDNRRCILKSWVCDSVDDCGDNSDERSCGVAKPGEACSPAEFTCGNNQCIPRSFHCDNHRDCLDGGSDETGCIAVHVTKPPQPAHVRLNPGESLRLECEAAGVPVPFINWRLNWGHIPAKCSSTSENGIGILSCTDMQPEDSGAYSCEAVNNRGTSFGAPDSIVIVNRTSVCPRGYFNSEARSPSECIRCFCFGESTQCKSADLFIYNMPTPLGEGGTRLVGVQQDYNGGIRLSPNPITDQYYYQPLRNGATVTKLEVYGYPTSTDSHPYLTLPESYNGNQLTSYGGYIRYRLSPQSPRPGSGYDSNLPDIIIKGKHETLIYNRRRADPRDNNIEVRLTQDEWQKSTANGLVPAAREDVMMALDNVELILLRASVNGAGVNITDFAMESAQSINVGLGAANLVEECTCPPGYEGLSCQKCSAGYTRESSGAWLGNCVREAPRPCPAGMYGDPSSGAGCQPCPCPLTNPENQFARTCSLGPRGNVICDCAPGYEGEQCQYCSQGFVGNPLVAGDSCRRQVTSNCDPIGTLRSRLPDECECKQNVQGQYCDQCKNGSFHLSDDNRHGCAQCFCSGVTERCTSSNLRRKTTSVTYNTPQIVSEVTVYQSAPLGDGSAVRYDAPVEASARPQLVRGELVLESVERSRDHIYYWSLPPSFALDKVTAYGGYLRYVLRNVPVSGASNNAPDIQLISHNRLTFHYFGDFKPSNDGVLDAQVQFLEKGWQRADGKGTTRQHFLLALADVKAILVKATYTTNYQIASLVSSSIDTADESGTGPLAAHVEQCVCPTGYLGTSCEDCAPGYTRSPRALYLKLCKPCECNGHSNMCDPESGQCFECQDNTAGPSCEECKSGYRRDVYNNCVPQTPDRWPRPEPDSCNCDNRGTVDEGARCDDRGNCNCKQLVTGESCDRCRQGSFGLSQDNPSGCIECYCSGVTSECYEVTNLFWDQIPAPMVGDLNYNNYTIMDLNARKVINDHFVPILEESELVYSFDFSPDEELFWSLPLLTLPGNMLLSYGGNLTFKQKFEVDNPYPVYNNPGTDVVLVGDEDSVYWTNPQSFRSGEYLFNQVPLLERNWFVLNSRVPASRNVFMGVLKNLRQVLVRATLADLNREKLSSTSIATVAMDKAGEERRPLAAKGIEVCRCPEGYTGRSCESCTAGYYRQRDRCLQCNCNGHNCHVGSYDQVVCDCPDRYSGPDCSIIGVVMELHPTMDDNHKGLNPLYRRVSITCKYRAPEPLTIQFYYKGNKIYAPKYYNTSKLHSDGWRGEHDVKIIWDMRHRGEILECHTITSRGFTLGVLTASLPEPDADSIVTTSRPPPPQSSVTVTISSPTIKIQSVGGFVNFTCAATSRYRQGPLPVTWVKKNGYLPQGRHVIDQDTGTLTITQVQVSDSGTYICQTSDGIGTGQASATLTVGSNPMTRPSVSIRPSVQEYYEGDRIELECVSSGNPTPTIDWRRGNGQPLPMTVQHFESYLIIENAKEEDSGDYRCLASNNVGTVDRIASITVRPRPAWPPREKLTISPSSPNVVEGQNTNVVCTGTANIPPGSIRWVRQDGADFASNVQSQNGVLYIDVARLENQGVYTCQTSSGEAESTPVLVTVIPLGTPSPAESPKIEVNINELKIPTGESGTVECTPGGYPLPRIQWTKHEGEFGSGTSQRGNTLIISNAQDDDRGYYVCTGTVDGTLVATTYVNVDIETRIRPRVQIWPQRDVRARIGDRFELRCQVLEGVPPPVILWSRSRGRELSSDAQVGPAEVIKFSKIDVNDEGEYICNAVNKAGNDTATAVLKVWSPPEITITPDRLVAVKYGDPVEVKCRANGYPEPMVSIKLRDRSGSRVVVPATPSVASLRIPSASESDEGDYLCSAAFLDQSVDDQFTIQVEDRGDIGFGTDEGSGDFDPYNPDQQPRASDLIVAEGQDSRLGCNYSGSYDYELTWSRLDQRPLQRNAQQIDNDLIIHNATKQDSAEYECNVVDRRTGYALHTAYVSLVVQTPPRITLRPITQTVSPGQSPTVECIVEGDDILDVSWNPVEKPFSRRVDVRGSTLIFRRIEVEDAGNYTCSARNRVAPASAVAQVLVSEPNRVASESHDNEQVARVGQAVHFRCDVAAAPATYQRLRVNWTKNNKPLPRSVRVLNDGSLYIKLAKKSDSGYYVCTIRDDRGGYTSNYINLHIEGFVECSQTQFRCNDGTGCIDDILLCDGHNDCEDHSDEYSCILNRQPSNTLSDYPPYNGPPEEEQALVAINQPYRQYQVGENVEVVCRALARNVDVRWQRFGSGSGLLQHVDQRPFGEGSSLILNSVAEPDAGVYRCTGTDQYQRTSYDDFTLQILPAPENPPYPPNQEDTTLSARLGQPAYIPCPRLEQPASVEWRREYSSLAPNIRANEPNLYIPRVSETDAGTYICRVSNGRTTTEARVILLVTGVVPQFNRYSWLAMPALSDAYTQFDIEISFKPTDSDGLILYDNGSSGHFIALRLVNSQPEIVLDAGSGPITVMGDRPLQLNTWHTVRLSRMNTKVTMNVDDAGPFTTEMPTKLAVMELDQPLHIGGVPDLSLLPPPLAGTQGFTGCVGMLVLGKQEKDIMMDSHKNRVTECDSCTPNMCLHGGVCQEARNERGYVCLCPPGFAGQNCDHAGEGCRPHICGPGKCTEIGDTYKCSCPITHTGHNCERQQSIEYPAFTGSAYLAIPAPQSMRGLYMSLKIKAMSPVTDGIIMYCAESEQGHGGFTSLAVRDQRVEFRYQTGDALQPVILTSHRELRPNEWTEVTIARTGSMVRLRINQNTDSVSSVLPYTRQAGDLHLKTAMYVGGVDDSNIILNNNTGVAGGFSGCIKDVNVQDSAVNIVNASIISANVQECSSYDRGDIPDEDSSVCSRCRNDGRCATPDATACTCPPGYSGTYCQNRAPQSPCSPNPCKRGTCRIDRGSRLNYTCDCPLGFSGINCHIPLELRQSVAFDGNGYVELAAENLIYDEDPVEFGAAIITTNADGILMYQRESTGRGQGDYFLLRLENARAVLEIDLGAGPMILTEEGVDVSNGERHVIVVRMYKNKLIELAVEGRSKTQVYEGLTSVMNADSNIYVGGMPEALNVWQYPGMTGCFESIQLNKNHRQSVDLNVAAVAARNAQRCKDIRRN